MSTAFSSSQYLDQMLCMLRGWFYADNEKEFFQDREMLVRSVCALSVYLKARAVRIPLTRQGQIFTGMVQTIKQHGNTGKIKRFSAYLLTCIQKHLQHHGEEYYDEGKRTRDALADVMAGLKPRDGRPVADPGDSVDQLAAFASIMRSKGGRKKRACKTPAKAMQLDFLNPSKP